jgi:hypothetical protein
MITPLEIISFKHGDYLVVEDEKPSTNNEAFFILFTALCALYRTIPCLAD